MTVRLHLPGVRVTGVVVDTPTELVVGVSSVKKLALREFVGLWSGWLVVGFMLGGVLGRRSFGGL